MAEESFERRLAAILVADVVGYGGKADVNHDRRLRPLLTHNGHRGRS